MNIEYFKKRIVAIFFVIMIVFSMPIRTIAGGVDPWAVAAGALTASFAYKGCLADVLRLGNNAYNQELTRQHDEKEQGLSPNKADRELIDRLMKRLTEDGEYELNIRSLPFRWQVNANKEFNACCYPTNYISVNSGIISGLCRNEDELAAVLAHEMTHGIELHSAYNYAKAVAQFYGLTFLNIATEAMDPGVLAVLSDYSIAKNVILPAEYEADEGGFYLMSSAGFNPGGSAAAMARMAYISKHPNDFTQVFEPYDHPDTEKREARLSELMTAYSCNHVKVKNGNEVFIDDIFLLKVDWTDMVFDNSAENAYLVAGALARAFHDYDSIKEWEFKRLSNGRIIFLEEDKLYDSLKFFVERNHVEENLYELVKRAYELEKISGARHTQHLEEKMRRGEWERKRQEALAAEVKWVTELRYNADRYVDLGLTRHASFEVNRFFDAYEKEDMVNIYSIIGRIKAYEGNFEEAIASCNMAVEKNSKDIYNYLNRADVYRAMGNPQKAILDCENAVKIDENNVIAYKMMADMYDELGDENNARKNYHLYKKLLPKAKDIPPKYEENKKK